MKSEIYPHNLVTITEDCDQEEIEDNINFIATHHNKILIKNCFLKCNINKIIGNINKNIIDKIKILHVYCYKDNLSTNNCSNNIIELVCWQGYIKNVNYMINSVKHLETGSTFNSNIDNLNNKLKEMKINSFFNKKINKIPKNIKFIKIKNDRYVRNKNKKADEKIFTKNFQNECLIKYD